MKLLPVLVLIANCYAAMNFDIIVTGWEGHLLDAIECRAIGTCTFYGRLGTGKMLTWQRTISPTLEPSKSNPFSSLTKQWTGKAKSLINKTSILRSSWYEGFYRKGDWVRCHWVSSQWEHNEESPTMSVHCSFWLQAGSRSTRPLITSSISTIWSGFLPLSISWNHIQLLTLLLQGWATMRRLFESTSGSGLSTLALLTW